MKIEYSDTIDEAVYVHFRLAELSGTVAKQRLYGLVWIPVIFLVLYCITPGTQFARMAAAILFSILYLSIHIASFKDDMRKRIRKVLIKALGTADPVYCEYEMNDEWLTFRKMGQELRFSWTNVVSVVDKPDAVEIIMKPTAIAVLPKRAFTNAQEVQEWLSFIENETAVNAPVIATAVNGKNAISR